MVLHRPTAEARQTIVTLAKLAGVAASTVSRALKGDPRISAATRARIEALALEHGYTPNVLARMLSGGRSFLIGLALGWIENLFYAELMQRLVSQADARGIHLLIVHAGTGPVGEQTANTLLQYQVAGCLMAAADLSPRAAELCAAHGVPVVMLNRLPQTGASAVACANHQGGQDLADFLLAGPHRRFAVVRGRADSSVSHERVRGFVERCAAAAAPIVASFDGGWTYDGGFAAGRAIAEMPPADRPDAVFAAADIMAMGVMDALRLAGIRMPESISVVGFDGIAPGMRPIYRLTTVAQPLADIVGRAFDLLEARIANRALPDEIVLLRGGLVVRDSARRPPGPPSDMGPA
jgi:DNA-binding LacI/PurR family transcriptional regulator